MRLQNLIIIYHQLASKEYLLPARRIVYHERMLIITIIIDYPNCRSRTNDSLVWGADYYAELLISFNKLVVQQLYAHTHPRPVIGEIKQQIHLFWYEISISCDDIFGY